MAYTVLARRYRPQTFDEVIGQDAVARTLRNAISADRVAHAYLFTGTRGVGKTTMARLLAKALNCEKGPTPDPCGKCDSCRRTQEGDDIDVIEIDGASNTGVDNVRELRSNAIYAPARSRFKIYIIDEVHMLSSGAFNALLKTLEEPPEHVKFIFATTDPQKVPGTIHSRCQRFDFRSVPTETIADYLAKLCKKEKIKAEKDALHVIAREGRGSVRDALTILDQAITLCNGDVMLEQVQQSLGLSDSQRYFDLAEAAVGRDAAKALTLLDAALGEGTEPGEFLDNLLEHLRSLLLIKMAGRDAPGLEATGEERAKLEKQAGAFTPERLTMSLELVGEARVRVRGMSHARPMVELAVVQLASLADLVPIGEALARLGPLVVGAAAGGGRTPMESRVLTTTAADEKKKSEAVAAGGGATAERGTQSPTPATARTPMKSQVPATAAKAGEIDDPGPIDEAVCEEPAGAAQDPLAVGAASASAGSSGATDSAVPLAANVATVEGEAEPPALLTAEEQNELRRDPKVRRLVELFEGRLVDMRRRRGKVGEK